MSLDSLSDAGTEMRTVAAHRPTIRGSSPHGRGRALFGGARRLSHS